MTLSIHTPSRARHRLAGILLAVTVPLVGVSSASAAKKNKAIVVATPGADHELASLRESVLAESVLALGGSVYFRYTSVTALSVLLPAQRVIDIAMLARSEEHTSELQSR